VPSPPNASWPTNSYRPANFVPISITVASVMYAEETYLSFSNPAQLAYAAHG
jgi:hypothetical protein